MMRNPRKEKWPGSFLLPLAIPQEVIDHQDCMGKEYDPKNKECSICADQALCANYYQQRLQMSINEIEKEKGPMLDQVCFENVDWHKIEKIVEKYDQQGEPIMFEELMDIISDLSSCKDDTAISLYIRRKLPKSNIELKEGYVIKRKDQNN